jgi:hypothetical protein
VLRIRIVGSAATIEGTCFLIHQERRDHDVVHYFLTSANLFNTEALGKSPVVQTHDHVVFHEIRG